MCGGPAGAGVAGWTQIRGLSHRLGPGNTNIRQLGTTRYTTLLVPTCRHHPRVLPDADMVPATGSTVTADTHI